MCKKELEKIYEIGEFDKFIFEYQVDGMLVFTQYGKVHRKIYVRDFDLVEKLCASPCGKETVDYYRTIKWIKFMVRIFEDEYIEAFEDFRQKELQKQIDKYNKSTEEMVEMAKDSYTHWQTK